MQEQALKNAIEMLKKTKEIINFAFQLEASIKYGYIKPENFLTSILVDKDEAEFVVERDWTLHKDVLKTDFAPIIKINTISFQIIACKESYASLFIAGNAFGLAWALETNNPDLFAAQNILKCVRDALGHFKTPSLELSAFGTWNFIDKKGKSLYPDRLEIKALDIILDTIKLQDKMFSWDHIGGIKNFIKILNYLENDLVSKKRRLSVVV